MALAYDKFMEIISRISIAAGDNEDVMNDLKIIADDKKEIAENVSHETYVKEDVFSPDGVKWSDKADDWQRRYRNRFLTGQDEIIEEQKKDVHKDTVSTDLSWDNLFKSREGDYK